MSELPAPYVVERKAANPFDLSLSCMLVVTFLHSTSPAYQAAVAIASGAPHYGVLGNGRGAMHVAGFDSTREDAARALALLNLIGEWKSVQAWCRGKQLLARWTVRQVLDCFLTAESATDWRAHCLETVDIERERKHPPRFNGSISVAFSFGGGEQRPPPAQDVRIFPCRLAKSRFRFDPHHPSSYADQVQATVVEHGCDWCPRFDPSITGRAASG